MKFAHNYHKNDQTLLKGHFTVIGCFCLEPFFFGYSVMTAMIGTMSSAPDSHSNQSKQSQLSSILGVCDSML